MSVLPPPSPASRDLDQRLRPLRQAGLVDRIPTRWQLLLGQIEMAPYVVMPDAGDAARYRGARCGHPLLRTPIVLSQVGWEHLRVGHGLDASLRALVLHLAYVYHEGMPTFDLQLVQTHEGGLDALRRFLEALEAGHQQHHERLIDLVIPDARAYRRQFLEADGWIDRAARFDYPPTTTAAAFLRPEFTQLSSFLDYCRAAFPESPRAEPPWRSARRIAALASRRLRERGR